MDSCAPASQPKLALDPTLLHIGTLIVNNNLPSTVSSHSITTSAHSAVNIDDDIPVSTREMDIERRLQCKRWTASEEFAATQCRAKWLKKAPKPGAYPRNFSPFVMQVSRRSSCNPQVWGAQVFHAVYVAARAYRGQGASSSTDHDSPLR